MKSCCLYFLISLLSFNLFGKVRNGYASQLESARRSLTTLYALLAADDHIKAAKRRDIESKIKRLEEFLLMYEVTEAILSQFRSIAPKLYNEIDSIKDRMGRSTDVYIMMIPPSRAEVQAWGVVNVGQTPSDVHGYYSEYGDHTVSVKIWNVNKALWVIAHEFGHIKYQVQNLSTYVPYLTENYHGQARDSEYVGHGAGDPSGESAESFEKSFRKYYAEFTRNANKPVETPLTLTQRLRRKLNATQRTDYVIAARDIAYTGL